MTFEIAPSKLCFKSRPREKSGIVAPHQLKCEKESSGRMQGRASYADSHVNPAYTNSQVNPFVTSQMQHMPTQRMQHMSTQRMQLNAAMKDFPGRPDSFSTEEEHSYKSSQLEEQWKWDRDAPNVSNQISSHSFNEGLGGNGTGSYYQDQMPEQRRSSDNQADGEPRSLSHEQDMEVGYEDNPSPLSFEGLERKFIHEIMNLAKEQNDAEDVENARHREKIIEINTRYQEKVSALRAKQATAREEFLHKELQVKLNRYQQPGTIQYRNPGLHDAHGYIGTPVAVPAEAHRDYATTQFESYRELPPENRREKTQGTEVRVPYPSGRVYNNAARSY